MKLEKATIVGKIVFENQEEYEIIIDALNCLFHKLIETLKRTHDDQDRVYLERRFEIVSKMCENTGIDTLYKY